MRQFQAVGPSNTRSKDCCIVTVFKVLFATTDVLDDARNTFIKNGDDQQERETQLDELMRGEQAFHWSDEELIPNGKPESPRAVRK